MALTNKAAIEAEYTAKANAIKAITQAQVDATLATVVAFILQCDEVVLVLQAREILNSRPIPADGPVPAALLLIEQLENGLAQIKAAVPLLQSTLPV